MTDDRDQTAQARNAGAADWAELPETMAPFLFPRRRRRRWRATGFGAPVAGFETLGVPPPQLDWRDRIQIARPEDQDPCNACTSFAFAGVMSDLATIRARHATAALSPGHLHSCVARRGCGDGLDPRAAARAAVATAVARGTDGDFPFDLKRCSTTPGTVQLGNAYAIASAGAAVEALQHGPIVAVMDLYDDFWRRYGGGVYAHRGGDYLGSHTVAIVGYDVDGGYWIVRNSHGERWGERGFALIRFEQCRIFAQDGHEGLMLELK